MHFIDAVNIRCNFTQIPNQAINLLLKKGEVNAFGLYCFMGSKPENFIFRINWLAKEMHWSESTVSRALNVLVKEGYIKRKTIRSSDGKFLSQQYQIYFNRDDKNEKKDGSEQMEETYYRKLCYPKELEPYCQSEYKLYILNYAVQMIPDADYIFLKNLNEQGELAYVQLMKEALEVLERKHPDNDEGYAITVLENKIKQYRMIYPAIAKGEHNHDGGKV